MLASEVERAVNDMKPTSEFIKLQVPCEIDERKLKLCQKSKKYPKFEELSEEEKTTVEEFVEAKENAADSALKMIHLESSTQTGFEIFNSSCLN